MTIITYIMVYLVGILTGMYFHYKTGKDDE